VEVFRHPSFALDGNLGATSFLGIQEESLMSKKLGIGDTLPNLTINLVKGGTIDLPGGIGSKYGVVLFYRGHW
jgi:hypothetical protein